MEYFIFTIFILALVLLYFAYRKHLTEKKKLEKFKSWTLKKLNTEIGRTSTRILCLENNNKEPKDIVKLRVTLNLMNKAYSQKLEKLYIS